MNNETAIDFIESYWIPQTIEVNLPVIRGILAQAKERERKIITDAFVFGYQCGGKSDDAYALAKLYIQFTFGRGL